MSDKPLPKKPKIFDPSRTDQDEFIVPIGSSGKFVEAIDPVTRKSTGEPKLFRRVRSTQA